MPRERLDEMLKIRVTERDREILDELRGKHTVSKFVRWLIRRAKYDAGPQPRGPLGASTAAKRTTAMSAGADV